ncbi:AAA family ATPase [Lonsdalea quercina]|uniref:AAA family ATPase n=1 Tax=Lonsdalea quercina TaxID=71657 RepID=UPI0039758FB7
MYKLINAEIDGFWGTSKLTVDLNEKTNIIIGRNGSGKTTFMDILQGVLEVDMATINNLEFDSVKLKLKDGRKIITISARKLDVEDFKHQIIEYKISRKSYQIRVIQNVELSRYPSYARYRFMENFKEVKQKLREIIEISSISVYRMKRDVLLQHENDSNTYISPVDEMLNKLINEFTQYQLLLSQDASRIANQLQVEVLISLLDVDDKDYAFTLDFDKEKEKKLISSAYKQLGVTIPSLQNKVNSYVNSVSNTTAALKRIIDKEKQPESKHDDDKRLKIMPLERISCIRKIISLSLDAEKRTKDIFSHLDLFIKILGKFFNDKTVKLLNGRIIVSKDERNVDIEKLSSGEKQLFILLMQALLQNKRPCLYMADEPELSLHISWQREIIPAIININPNAQILVATHSPEVAGKYRDNIVFMERIVHG